MNLHAIKQIEHTPVLEKYLLKLNLSYTVYLVRCLPGESRIGKTRKNIAYPEVWLNYQNVFNKSVCFQENDPLLGSSPLKGKLFQLDSGTYGGFPIKFLVLVVRFYLPFFVSCNLFQNYILHFMVVCHM